MSSVSVSAGGMTDTETGFWNRVVIKRNLLHLAGRIRSQKGKVVKPQALPTVAGLLAAGFPTMPVGNHGVVFPMR